MMNAFVISLLLLIGLYFPTSENSVISSTLLMLNSVILIVLIGLLILKKFKINRPPLLIALGINLILVTSTLFTPFPEYKYGMFIYYLSLSIVFCLDLSGIEIKKTTDRIFFSVNVINLFLGFSIIMSSIGITDFIISNYSAAYSDLVPNMIMQQKPVLTFATHSVAGFFLFIFFYLCFTKYKYTNSIYYLIFTFCYLILMFYLKSVTSYIFMLIAVVLMVHFFAIKKRELLYVILSLFLFSYLVFIEKISEFFKDFSLQLSLAFGSSGNGLIGRYSSTGNLRGNFEYLSENFFRPVGFGYSPEIMYVDSGYVEYLTRGTFILVILIFLGFFLFLKRNLNSKKDAYLIFSIVLFFEVGYSGLTYYRTIYLLPFIVTYLNYIHTLEASTSPQ